MSRHVKNATLFLMSQACRVYAIYILTALLIIGPLLQSGYILTLDLVFTPRLPIPTDISDSYTLELALHALNFILPSDSIEKIILASTLLLSGIGMYRLLQHLHKKTPDIYQTLSWYFAGLLYMVNPFTYDRFMAGQYEVLLGYALLPWFVRSLLSFLGKPRLRPAIALSMWILAISIVSIHAIGFMAILIILAFGFRLRQNRNNKKWIKDTGKYGLIVILLFLIGSSYWLFPLMLGHGSTARTIDSFNSSDQAAFSTLGGSTLGRFGNVIRLQGFWAEGQNLYILPQAKIFGWGLFALAIWLLVITGCFSLWHSKQKFIVIWLVSSMVIATILAVGVLNSWLATHVPFFAGYREPEKFVALIALAYAILASYGVAAALRLVFKKGGSPYLILASIILILVPILWTSTMWWGFNNQLVAVQYPADWFTVNNRLDSDPGNFQTLFLPWHEYMSFNFAGRIIANPAPQFFDKPIIISNNPQFMGSTPTPDSTDTAISNILATATTGNSIGSMLNKYQVKYVILDQDVDYLKYNYLNHQTDLKLIYKGDTLELYRNEDYRG